MGGNSVLKINEDGEITLPLALRREIGLEHGGNIAVSIEDGALRIQPLFATLQDLQHVAAPCRIRSGDTVDQFIADRRREAERK